MVSQSPMLIGLVVLLALALLAIILLAAASHLRRRSGLPEGEVVYDDTSGVAGNIFFSRRYGLSGKPDYLLYDESDGIIPVEVKSGAAPRMGKPYDSHLLQLAVYFLLIEDALGRPVSYGLIRYRDRTLRIDNTESLRTELLAVLEQMRRVQANGAARRTHNQARRCVGCSMSESCGERLA